MEFKHELTAEFASVVKSAVREQRIDQLQLSSDVLNAICNVTEAVFIHGLKEAYFLKSTLPSKYPDPNFWPFVAKLTNRGVRQQIANLSQIRSEIGKARAWIRIALSDNTMENYVESVIREVKLVKHYYHRYAYLRDSEQIEIMKDFLKALGQVALKIPINSSALNTWTPTPLKLAGLLKKPGPGAQIRNHAIIPEMDDVEIDVPVAMSALEYEGLEDNYIVAPPYASSQCSSPTLSTISGFSVSTHNRSNRFETSTPGAEFHVGSNSCASHLSEQSHMSLLDAQFNHILNSIGQDPEKDKEQFADSGVISEGMFSPPGQGYRMAGVNDFDGQREAVGEVIVYRRAAVVERARSPPVPLHTSASVPMVANAVGLKNNSVQTVDQTPVTSAIAPLTNTSLHSATDVQVNTLLQRADAALPATPHFVATDPQDAGDISYAAKDENSLTESSEHVEIFNSGDINVSKATEQVEDDRHSSAPRSESSSFSIDDDEKHSANIAKVLEDCGGFSPGNSLLGRASWSSGFVSNQPTDAEFSFNTVLQRTLNQTVLSTSPTVHTVEATGGPYSSQQFADEINQTVEVGRPAEAGDGQPTRESSRRSSPDFVLVQAETPSPQKESRVSMLTKLPCERGLDAQNFKCASCSSMIGLMYGEFRICNFDGCYYCPACHACESYIIPSRIIFSWDLEPRGVSRASKAFLDHIAEEPLMDLQKANAAIYDFVPEMKEAQKLREQLSYVAMYLLTCKESVAEELRKRLWPKEYFYEHVHLYSVNDLFNATTGQLQKVLRSTIAFAVHHVQECRLCSQKGFICELCAKQDVIYPFQVDVTQRCSKCFSVYHIDCIRGRPCPKCQRKEHQVLMNESGAGTSTVSAAGESRRGGSDDTTTTTWPVDLIAPPNL